MTALTGATRMVPAKSDPRVPGRPSSQVTVDVAGLKRALRKAVSGEVRFDPGTLAMYANDASNFRQVPIGVVIPKTLEDVVATHRVCSEFDAPVLNRGGGTSLSGETVNVAVVIDHSKYLTEIGEIDAGRGLVTCQPGVINENLNKVTGKQNLVFGPDPSSHSRCVIGGNLGNNSCGIHSVQAQLYGPGPRTSDNTHALEIVTYDGHRFWVGVGEEDQLDSIIAQGGAKGEIYAKLRDLRDRYADAIRAGFPSVAELPRRVSGFNLDELLPEKGFNVARALVGTESTCATVLQATLMLTPALLQRTLVVVRFPDVASAGELCVEITDRWRPIGLEAIDHQLVQDQQEEKINVSDLQELPGHDKPSGAWLMVQFGADHAEESEATAGRFAAWLTAEKGLSPDDIVVSASEQEGGDSQKLWKTTGPAGRTRRCRPPRSPATCGSCSSCTPSTASGARCTGTSDRAASTPGSASTSARPAG
jgi:FAD/FMN-containing dehydrogenase